MLILRSKYIIVASTLLLSLNNCAGETPYSSTQTGTATGAVAGAVIGYNTKGHHKGQRAVIGGLLGAAVGAGIGNAVDKNNPPPSNDGGWQ